MPHRRDLGRVSLVAEAVIDLITTIVLTLVFHFVFDMPWVLALLIAGPASVFGWWCLLHLERDDPGGSWLSRVFDE